jgi:bacterioferritin-associated ferredoxin
MYLCICNAITDRQARSRVSASCSVAAFYRALGVKPKCGKCVPQVREMLEAQSASSEARPDTCRDVCQDACGAEG